MTWEVTRNGDVIVVQFDGQVTPEDGVKSVTAFIDLLLDDQVTVVFDAHDVQYSPDARKVWQRALWPRRRQIARVGCCCSSSIVRMSAIVFAKFLHVSYWSPEHDEVERLQRSASKRATTEDARAI